MKNNASSSIPPSLHPGGAPSACVILPTYNNCATVGAVVREVARTVPASCGVIVVDDGSTDGASELLRSIPGLTVVTHQRNMGKGAALMSGFARASEMGFTHAVTLDTDGQHFPEEIPAFLAAIEAHPDAIVVGVRDLSGGGAPRKSRLLRANSNFWVWVHTGRWVHDTQCGFRAYPLATLRRMLLKSRKYDFEIEALVKAMWTGVPVVEAPVRVRYGTGSGSHFRPIRDFALVTHLNGCLLSHRVFLPGSLRRVMFLRSYQQGPFLRRSTEMLRAAVIQESGAPGQFAACIGVGVFFGIVPIWGFQILTAMLVAHRLRLSKPLVLAATNVSFPLLIPFIIYLSLLSGQLVMTGRVDATLSLHAINRSNIWQYGVQYVVGSIALAIAAGAAAAGASYALARIVVSLRRAPANPPTRENIP